MAVLVLQFNEIGPPDKHLLCLTPLRVTFKLRSVLEIIPFFRSLLELMGFISAIYNLHAILSQNPSKLTWGSGSLYP